MFTDANNMLSTEGIVPEIVQGGRSWNLQKALYMQGRDTLANVNATRASVGLAAITEAENERPVTWAQPGDSWHNYFMALDSVPFIDGQPVWDVGHPHFVRMVAVLRSVGFVCGIDWQGQKKDSDHFEYSGKFVGSPSEEVKSIFMTDGAPGVWAVAYSSG